MRRTAPIARLVAVPAALWLAGCGCEHGIVGDGFAIPIDLSSGPVMVQVREGDVVRSAVVDMLAPFTVLDAPDDEAPSRRCADLTVLGAGGVARAHLNLTVTESHYCPPDASCQVGPAAAPLAVDAIVGADAFAPGAVRFDFSTSEMFLFPDIAGDADARGRLCEAVFPDPFYGGGTLNIGGTLVSFDARRIAFGACLSFHEFSGSYVDEAIAGVDVELVVSTGIGPTILARSAYERFRLAGGAGEPFDALPAASVWIPWGLVEGKAAQIDRMALVGGHDDERGPCKQVYAHHVLTEVSCNDSDFLVLDKECPCADADFCRVPAIVELTPTAPIDVIVVPDDHEQLQALRTELRPRAAEVEGILGVDALRALSVDVDATNDWVLMRCKTSGCTVRPDLITVDVRDTVQRCLERAGDLIEVDAGVPDAGMPDAMAPDAAAAVP